MLYISSTMTESSANNLSVDSNVTIQPPVKYCQSVDSNMIQQLNPPFSFTGMIPSRGSITHQDIENVETELDFYERVSMVFLLYSDVDVALQRLKAAESAERTGSLSQSGLLSDWARAQPNNAPHWEETFLEALCIIQNYEMVEKLGYKRRELQERFLPHNREIVLTVDLLRKALYIVCEKLTYDQGKRLIDLVEQDLERKFPSLNGQEPDFLEIHFLYWISQRHILIQNRLVDVKNITKHLKVMDQLNLVEYLDSIAKKYPLYVNPCFDDSSPDTSGVFCGNSDSHSIVSSSDCRQMQQTGDRYHIDPKNVGYCVIINQKNFRRDPDPKLKNLLSHDELEDRIGTDADRDRLVEAFLNLGFKLKLFDNLSHMEMKEAIETSVSKLVEDHHSCFALCILSHGKLNEVYGVNSVPVSIDEIGSLIHGKYCSKLLGKPKILIIQACQGQDTQNALPIANSDISADGPAVSQQTRPGVSDLLTLWSTVPGYASFRHAITGSWFIQSLCDHLLAPPDEVNIISAAIAVNNAIQRKTTVFHEELKCMQPQFTVTLSKQLILPCDREARKTVAESIVMRHLFDVMLVEYLEREYHDRLSKIPRKPS